MNSTVIMLLRQLGGSYHSLFGYHSQGVPTHISFVHATYQQALLEAYVSGYKPTISPGSFLF
jgi:hypothetical protein